MTILKADRYVHSVDLIDVDDLRARGIRCVLVDRDNTLVPRDTNEPPAEIIEWVKSLHSHGIAVCMVSNNFHTDAVCASAEEIGCAVVHHAMKPAPVAIKVAQLMLGVPAEQTVLVGDQLLTDVLAGNLAGVQTILVRPQSTKDLWYTQIFRRFEKHVLNDVKYEGE